MTPNELSTTILNDKPLAQKRRLLVTISMLVLASFLTKAKLEEVNTFIFKLSFENMEGVMTLLLLSVGFLLVRYHAYAAQYQAVIRKEWTSRVLKHYFFERPAPPDEPPYEISGFVVDVAPKNLSPDDPNIAHDEDLTLTTRIHPNWFFNAQIEYDLFNKSSADRDENQKVYIVQLGSIKAFANSLKALLIIYQTWWDAQIRYRASLDLYAPYFIALFAVGCASYDGVLLISSHFTNLISEWWVNVGETHA
ncbi:hypothetical protein [Vibrio parahaemolyticus]|uniref:hypothetical protein n=1 Tax=Vibrio parahaemolyticus TaxID=670 RepID=UPI0003E2B467|nr:hypothetical protein [Vibrio parahaemolyticus]EGR0035110.1 hypothetical protein [Vibrio parahaemolyticus]EGR0203711.1 hypothetical protein [Vibrio parahaemolyticus]EGR2292519.1 hypothetical protein [Vibrio parahaemolyticus]EGR9082678.1 hypothetical protein [Vibrio parahaemolyticus]EGR9084160.1 hypothetical protein [Vibrio parahaemolyticus]